MSGHSMFPYVQAFPREHGHGSDPGVYGRLNIKQIRIDFAAVEVAVEKLSLVRGEIE